jgi:flagella basal body P-ring formation protein FlgA
MIARAASVFATLCMIAVASAEPIESPGSAGARSGAERRGEPIDDAIRSKLEAMLPNNLGVAQVFVPTSLAHADASRLVIEAPRELRAGRTSIKILIRGKTSWVPVSLAPLADVAVTLRPVAAGDTLAAQDFAVEHRAVDEAPAPIAVLVGSTASHDLAAGAPIASHDVSLPPPLPRGTLVAVEHRRGAVVVKGHGVLELAARPGQPASVRLQFLNKTVLHGVLVAPATVVIGDLP